MKEAEEVFGKETGEDFDGEGQDYNGYIAAKVLLPRDGHTFATGVVKRRARNLGGDSLGRPIPIPCWTLLSMKYSLKMELWTGTTPISLLRISILGLMQMETLSTCWRTLWTTRVMKQH